MVMRNGWLMVMAAAGLALPAAGHAQSAIEGRVGRLESEMRAVQRKVFPGGANQYVQPDIAPAAPEQTIPGTPAASAVSDLDARVSSIDGQVRRLTNSVEELQHRVGLLEDSFANYKQATDARLKALEDAAGGAAPNGGGSGASSDSGAGALPDDSVSARPPVRPNAAKPAASRPAPALVPAVSKDPSRAAAVAAVEHPQSDDPAEAAYLYGYKLWSSKYYPEAEAQRASYAQNLLGRSYLDDGKAALAALALYDNYKKMPDGDRAPDSLYYLAQALTRLHKPADEVCKVYDELNDVYGAKIGASLKADVARGRVEAKCK
jgi:TolA-binding protein